MMVTDGMRITTTTTIHNGHMLWSFGKLDINTYQATLIDIVKPLKMLDK